MHVRKSRRGGGGGYRREREREGNAALYLQMNTYTCTCMYSHVPQLLHWPHMPEIVDSTCAQGSFFCVYTCTCSCLP